VEETLQSELQNIYSMCATGLSLPGTKLIKKNITWNKIWINWKYEKV